MSKEYSADKNKMNIQRQKAIAANKQKTEAKTKDAAIQEKENR